MRENKERRREEAMEKDVKKQKVVKIRGGKEAGSGGEKDAGTKQEVIEREEVRR